MSGKKQFDQELAMDQAMSVFKDKGFSGASLAELENATGLNKSSIYNTFDSKEGLYQDCLHRFRTAYSDRAMQIIEQEDIFLAFRQLFDLFGGFDSPSFPNGCMATLAALEMGGDNTSVAEAIALGLNTMIEQFEARLLRAVEEGQLPEHTQCNALAAMIVAVCRGVIVLNKGTGDPDKGRLAYQQLLMFIFPHHAAEISSSKPI